MITEILNNLHFKKYFPFENINELSKDGVLVALGTARPDRNEGKLDIDKTFGLLKNWDKAQKQGKNSCNASPACLTYQTLVLTD